ncbi:PepSY-associated TM helix domain-containing protein [Ferrimonas balearica]|uniref:PepSY-associated TM helix domain-containing protein n=1 Tax=Ferrimonas balearica TaxID=44012 RepID=UPI001C994A95|nr:PepSY domain-containing protein [Ferrimonas balearica]MBY5921856.1 PepSY domain-containing protein [Ferrimonas balearica]MBY5994804.1 PepSY domain-containing protein [Ferrimonas balearica]
MAALRWLHRWVGLVTGVAFTILTLTGVYLGAEEWWRQITAHGQSFQPQTLLQQGQTLDRLSEVREAAGETVTGLAVPTSQYPFYRITAGRSQYDYAASDDALLAHSERGQGGLGSVMMDLHRTFMLGRDPVLGTLTGPDLAAIITLIGAGLGLIGLVLWWPLRRGFRWRTAVIPRNTRRGELFKNHVHGATLLSLPLLLLCITGAAVTYRSQLVQWLDAKEVEYRYLLDTPVPAGDTWTERLAAAQRLIPDGEFQRVSWPRFRGEPKPREGVDLTHTVQLAFATPEDWFGVPNSRVFLDLNSGQIQAAYRFDQLSLGQKLYRFIVPLHSGRLMPSGYTLTITLLCAWMSWVMITGMVAMIQGMWPKRRRAPRVAKA